MNGSAMQFDTRTMNLALKIIDGVTAERGRSPFAALAQGIMPTSLPDLGYDEAVRVAELGSELLKRADAVDAAALPGDLGLTFEIARGQAKVWSRCSDWYWLIIDASFPVAFLPTVYGGGYLLNTLKSVFSPPQEISRGAQPRHLALGTDFGRMG